MVFFNHEKATVLVITSTFHWGKIIGAEVAVSMPDLKASILNRSLELLVISQCQENINHILGFYTWARLDGSGHHTKAGHHPR
jgi:hypothetical protein